MFSFGPPSDLNVRVETMQKYVMNHAGRIRCIDFKKFGFFFTEIFTLIEIDLFTNHTVMPIF